MEDLFKKVEMLLSDTGISSKVFWSVDISISRNTITLFAYFEKQLASTCARLGESKLDPNGYVNIKFEQYETNFNIVLC
jgi:hypothetical protein